VITKQLTLTKHRITVVVTSAIFENFKRRPL